MARRVASRQSDLRFRVALWITIPLGCAIIALLAILWIGDPNTKTTGPMQVGVTFSAPYARELSLDWRETLTETLDDLGVRYFRIPAYWSIVEPKKGLFSWTETDYEMDEIAARNGNVTLAIGAKLPRWPECWIPVWAQSLSAADEHTARLLYVQKVVERYRAHPALEAWQVENEALFPFGVCPKPDRAFLKEEIALVRSLDPNHPVFTTDSGELSTWLSVGPLADGLGVSTYRVVLTPQKKILRYTWIPPYWYARHALLVSAFVKGVYISEFQMEPWASVIIDPVTTQSKTFSTAQMMDNFAYADRMRIQRISFWGVEWWWWMKVKHNDSSFWDLARTYFHTHTR
jgi:hypothetical protein